MTRPVLLPVRSFSLHPQIFARVRLGSRFHGRIQRAGYSEARLRPCDLRLQFRSFTGFAGSFQFSSFKCSFNRVCAALYAPGASTTIIGPRAD